jgi:hypothetical protein
MKKFMMPIILLMTLYGCTTLSTPKAIMRLSAVLIRKLSGLL